MLEPNALKTLVRLALYTQPVELTCDECLELIDQFIELELAGKNAAEALPLVEEHLRRCTYCRLEYEALLIAVRGTTIL
jgi:hypothetical protein